MTTAEIIMLVLISYTTFETLFGLSYTSRTASLKAESEGAESSSFSAKYHLQLSSVVTGWLAAACLLILPYVIEKQDPLLICGVRVACFYYACKIADLGSRAWHPPVLQEKKGQAESSDSPSRSILFISTQDWKYVWLALIETRYLSFDIAVKQPGRREDGASRPWAIVPVLAIPAAVYLLPSPETKSLLVLLVIQLGLESMHSILHRSCPNPLFWRPFAAPTITDFWRTHWHGSADPFLRTLAYEPASKLVLRLGGSKSAAKACGVLAVFNLSGIWHAWATAALSYTPWTTGLQVWSWFMGMGVCIILESALPRRYRGTLPHQFVVWAFMTAVSNAEISV